LYAGISSGFVYQPQTVMQNSTSFNGYAQLNHQNINNGTDATSDYVATADNGTESTYYIDMGIASSGYDNTSVTNALGTSLFPNDGYLYVQGDEGFEGGNLTVGTSTTGKIVKVIAGGIDSANIIASFTNVGLTVNAATSSSSTTTGALQVAGGAGVVGNAYIGGLLNVAGTTNLSGGITFTTATGGGLQAAAIGNVTPGSGAFTTLSASSTLGVTGATTLTTATTGGLQAKAIGNVTPGSGAFTTLTASSITQLTNSTESTNTTSGALQVTGGVGIVKNLNVGGDVIITGNLTVDGDVTTVNTATLDVEDLNITVAKGAGSAAAANGAGLTVDGANATFTYANADDTWNLNKGLKGTSATFNTETVGGLQAVAIGNVTPGTGAFTSLTTQTETVGGLQAVAIGNVTPGTGAFTTLSATGTTALNTVTGASFQGVIGNVTPNAGAFTTGTFSSTLGVTGATTLTTATAGGLQAVAIGNVTPGTGTFTVLTATTSLTAPSINNTAIGNVTPSTGAFTTLTATTWANVTSTVSSTSSTTGALTVAGGLGVAGNLNVGTYGTSYHSLGGNVLIGRGPITPAAIRSGLVINRNTSAVLDGDFGIHVSSTEDVNSLIAVDSFGTGVISGLLSRHARGTASSPTAVQADDNIGGVEFRGYGSTGFSTNAPAGMFAVAKENFTDVNQGTALSFDVVPTGSNTAVTMAYLGTDGNLLLKSVTPSTSTTTGALVVSGGAGIAGNVHTGGNVVIAGGLTVESYVYGNSGAQFSGRITSLSNADMTEPGTGSLFTPGGASIGGNVYVGSSIFIGPASFERSIAAASIIGVNNGTDYAQSAMINTAGSGSSDFAAYSANGSDAGGWVDMGIAGNVFSDPNYTITKPQDGYLFTRPVDDSAGGNLVIGTSEAGSHNDVIIGVGSFLEESEVARFHGNVSTNGTFVVKLPTNAVPAANTGAFQVWGGSSVSGNAYVGGALTVNGSQTANYDFKVAGKNTTNLVWARPSASYDQVVIGDTLAVSSLVGGAKLAVNSTDSLLLPVGTSGERPGSNGFTDVTGMFRFNTTIGAIEWYTGSTWASASTTFTIITDEQFNGDGSTVEFELGGATTTAGTIVSINGVVQIPTLAYAITGAGNTTLEFTEAPAIGDIIDVRRLTTTQTLFGIASPNGKNAIQTDNNGVYIYTGSATSTVTTSWDAAGNEISNRANVTVSSANTATTIVTMNATAYRSGKFVVQATHGTDYQVMEALVIHDGTTASVMPYGIVQTNGNLGVLSATYSSGNVLLQFVASNTSTIVRTKSDFLTI